MNNRNKDLAPDILDDSDGFELELRNRTLGRGPANRDQIMYQCGYAAGLASAAKQLAMKLAQWRLLGTVASILAVASLMLHLVAAPTGPISRPVADVTERAADSASQANAEVWLSTLTHGTAANGRTREVTTVRTLNSDAASVNESSFSIDWPDSNQSILKPSDFTDFLNGDA